MAQHRVGDDRVLKHAANRLDHTRLLRALALDLEQDVATEVNIVSSVVLEKEVHPRSI